MDNSQNQNTQGSKTINYLLVILFVILILVIAGGAYYFLFAKKSTNNLSSSQSQLNQEQQAQLATPTVSKGPTPTLTQVPFTYSFKLQTNIHILFVNAWFSTLDPKNGVQSVKVEARDGENIVSMSATVETDKLKKTYPLTLTSGTAKDGFWSGSWTLGDTYDSKFIVTFIGKDVKNNSNSYTVRIR